MKPASSGPLWEWLQNTPVAETIQNSHVLLPAIEILHLLGLMLLVGTVWAVDVNLLGIGMRRQQGSRIAQELLPWTWAGLIMLLITGPLLFMSDAEKISMNSVFPVKMALLVVATVFHFTIYRKAATGAYPSHSIKAKLAGGVSLLLWVGTGFAAKAMDFFA
jgi:hypothetical protein